MEVLICDLPTTVKIDCNNFIHRAFGEFELKEDNTKIDSESNTCRIYCNKQIDRATLEQKLEEHSLAGQHARIGCDSDLPVGIECSGLVVTFRLGRSHNHLSLRAKENLSKFANRIRSLVTNSVTEESSNTPVEIAFPQKFLAASGGIHKSQGQIEIDASRKENLDLLRPVYRDIAAKHFASVRDLFANKLPRVWKSLVSLGVKVDPEPCHKEVHRMLENGATVEPEVEFATVEPEVEFATVELEVEFENCEDIDVVWQKLGLDSPEYKAVLRWDEQRRIVTITGRAVDARAVKEKIEACRDSLVHIDITDLNSPGMKTYLTSQSGVGLLLHLSYEANRRSRHCRIFVLKKPSMNRRSVRQNVSDKAMNVIGEALCGSKVTIAVVRGDLFTVQASAVFIPLTKLDIEKRDCSSALWSTFVDVDKHACEAALSQVIDYIPFVLTSGLVRLARIDSQHLSCSHVCFACTPTPWSYEQEAQRDLEMVMERCLSCMNDGLMSTLSIEVTAWQELGYPEAVVVQTIKTACEQYSGKRALKIYLPVNNNHIARTVCSSFDIEDWSALSKSVSDASLKRMVDWGENDNSAGDARRPSHAAAAAASSACSPIMPYTFANVTLLLYAGTLHDFEASALVCTVTGPKKSLLNVGAVGAAFYNVGGEDLDRAYVGLDLKETEVGSIPKQAGFRCDRIIFLSVRKWDNRTTRNYLQWGIQDCLAEAEKYKCSSIAFPAIGSGRLHYPVEEVAAILWDICRAKQSGFVKQVFVVAYGDEVWQNYSWEFRCIEHPTSLQLSDRDADADGELDKAEADVAAAADVGEQPSCSRGLVIRIVAVDQPTANRVETEVREHLKELFISDTVTDAVVSVLQPCDAIELKSRAGSVEEVFVDIDKTQGIVTIRGHKDVVSAAQARVTAYLRELAATPLYKTLLRGDQGLLDVLANSDVPFPSSWSINRDKRPVNVSSSFVHRSLCPPSSAEFAVVNQLVQATWKPKLVGQGADARNLMHKNIVVTKVERIENPEQFKKYTECRRDFCKRFHSGDKFPSVKSSDNGLDVETSAVDTSALDWRDNEGQLKHCPLPLINEVLLFHGTKPDVYEAIVRDGFDPRLNKKGMFGTGAYLAESSTKADQYADAIDARQPKGDKYMILARVILGHPYVCTKPHQFCRPPCVEPKCNRKDMCVAPHKKSHSVIGVNRDNGLPLLFREFVLYDSSQCYPLYLITYNRV